MDAQIKSLYKRMLNADGEHVFVDVTGDVNGPVTVTRVHLTPAGCVVIDQTSREKHEITLECP